MINPFTIASALVIASLGYSLICWLKILNGKTGNFKKFGVAFCICFGLYIIGQTIALLNAFGLMLELWSVVNYLFAAAAITFGIGSYFAYNEFKNN